MKTKLLILSLASLLIPIAAESKDGHRVVPFYIYNAASQHHLDSSLMYAFCKVESQCKAHAINRNDGTPEQKAAGLKIVSYGLFQIQASTAEDLGFVRYTSTKITVKRGKKFVTKTKSIDHIKELLNPEINAWYAAKYIKSLYAKYHSTPKVISAYNAGHPVKSNKDYVLKVMSAYISLQLDGKY